MPIIVTLLTAPRVFYTPRMDDEAQHMREFYSFQWMHHHKPLHRLKEGFNCASRVDSRTDLPITWSFHGTLPVGDVGLVGGDSVVPCALVLATLFSSGPATSCVGAVPARRGSTVVETRTAFCAQRGGETNWVSLDAMASQPTSVVEVGAVIVFNCRGRHSKTT